MSSGILNEVIGGKYDIKALLGEGGSGIVYLAKKLKTNERYAIKTISTEDKNALKLLERETQTLKRLNHPSIDIIDGDKSKNGEMVENLHISIGDFCNPDIFESLLEKGKIETDFKAQESEIGRRRKALRAIRYGDSENTTLCKVISDPGNSLAVEPLVINQFFNEQLDISQQQSVCKALEVV